MSNRWTNLDAWGKANGFPLDLERSIHLEALAEAPYGTDWYDEWISLPAAVQAEHMDFMKGMRAMFAPVSRPVTLCSACEGAPVGDNNPCAVCGLGA